MRLVPEAATLPLVPVAPFPAAEQAVAPQSDETLFTAVSAAHALPAASPSKYVPTTAGYGLPTIPPKPKPPKLVSSHPSAGRSGFGAALYLNMLIVFGGEGPGDNYTGPGTGRLQNDLWGFDMRRRTWARWPSRNTSNGFDLPVPRANASVALDGDVLIVACGHGNKSLLEVRCCCSPYVARDCASAVVVAPGGAQ